MTHTHESISIVLRDFCVTRSCFVMLCTARLWISNGHPASVVVKNQAVIIAKNPSEGSGMTVPPEMTPATVPILPLRVGASDTKLITT
jgi:hypothetical protein